MGEVYSVVAVNELGGVRRASAIWEQGPCLGKVLGTVLEQADPDTSTALLTLDSPSCMVA